MNFRISAPAISALLCASIVPAAGEPAPPPRDVSSRAAIGGSTPNAARAGTFCFGNRPAGPHGAAFASSLFPSIGPSARRTAIGRAPTAPPEGYEVIVFAPHRTIRISVELGFAGAAFDSRWKEALAKAFAGFDRDRDGYLNGYEVQYIFSDGSLAALMQNGYYAPNPSDPPTLEKLDADGDRQVSFAEFAAYYEQAAVQAIRAFPPMAEDASATQATEALYKFFDRNGDGKLAENEIRGIEKLLAALDADEDECLSLDEIFQGKMNQGIVAPVRVAQREAAPEVDVARIIAVYGIGQIPPTVAQRILEERDWDGDGALTRAESGFDAATFTRLDANGDGEITELELDRWRTGPPDLRVRLALAAKEVDCKVEIITDMATVAAREFTIGRLGPGRIVLHHGRQQIELWAGVPMGPSDRPTLKQQLEPMYAQAAGAKGYVEEKDLLGAAALQFQLLRVMFDPADFNSDGKLMREEFDRYVALQQSFVDLAIGIAPSVQTPTLFQLLDENHDGRLGVRELRTAWDRLLVLEPPGLNTKATFVTRAAILPAASIRLGRAVDRFAFAQMGRLTSSNRPAAPQNGPTWFRKMDRNGDGDVSRAEFLGTRAEFDAIDVDRDGLISLGEAEAYDKLKRSTR